jgi:Zn-dependent M28 family amino/carboxypeptidase
VNRLRTRISVWCLIATLAIATAGPAAQAQGKKTATRGNVDAIKAERLKEYLYYVAADEMEGRDTPSRGLDLTAKFIAMNLALWGVKPGGDNNTYFQKILLRKGKVDPKTTSATLNGTALVLGEDYTARANPGTASGSLIYVGNGWYYPAKGINAYKGVDVRNKIAVIFGAGFPRGVSFNDLRAAKEGVDFESPLGYLKKNGARGAIMVAAPTANFAQEMQRSVERGSNWQPEKFQKEDARPIPSIMISQKVAKQLFEAERTTADDLAKALTSGEMGESFDLSVSKQAKFQIGMTYEQTSTQNVIGIVEGSDAKLKSEYVAIGAHYDHVGIRNPASGSSTPGEDVIFNGADDDGSGTVAVLAIAEAFAKGATRPRRSLLFVWHAGEEKGLWGSQYVTDYPVVPVDQIVTQLNIDMIGRSREANDKNPANVDLTGPNEVYIIGSKMMSTELGVLSESVNDSFLKLTFNYKYDDPKDPQRFFYRSDHYNYARKGIPIIFYFSGVHQDYHRPSDHPDKIDYAKMEKITRTVMATGWELANRATRPKVDKPLSPELMPN